jgi:hypothetical protein
MTRDFAQLEKSLEHRAYLEAGQAVMAYLARKGWTGKWLFLVPDDSPLTLPAVEKITIESKGTEWNAVVEGLRNRVNVSLVLLAAYTTERIKYYARDSNMSTVSHQLMRRARDLMGGYVEEMRGDKANLQGVDSQINVEVEDLLGFAEMSLRGHWRAVEALAKALQQYRILSEDAAFRIVEDALGRPVYLGAERVNDNRQQAHNSLEVLVGTSVGVVSFVMDYVQIHFNGPVLTCLTNPIVELQDERWRFPEPGSRDALCSLIEQVVVRAIVEEDVQIQIDFVSGHRLKVPLDYESRVGPEAANLNEGPFMTVW